MQRLFSRASRVSSRSKFVRNSSTNANANSTSPSSSTLMQQQQHPDKQVQEAAVQLLPPLQLYRRLLRIHRTLPREMRSLGDEYVRDEFKRHKSTDNPLHIVGFLRQWKMYLDQLESSTPGQGYKGRKLEPELLDKLSTQQVGQLYEFLQATKDLYSDQQKS